ncbi:hypothetical protein Tco_0586766 [Tanacetum coccineum]
MYETCALRKQSTVRLTVGLSPTIILWREKHKFATRPKIVKSYTVSLVAQEAVQELYVLQVFSTDITNKIACRKFLIKNEEEIFTVRGDGVGIKPDGVASPAMLYLMRRSLKVLRKFHWTTLGGRSNQLSHVD